MDFEYKDQRNKNARKTAEQLLAHLPYYVSTFVVGREGRMSAQTEYIYVSRINSFYQYLSTHEFKDREMRDISLKDLSTLHTENIEAFAAWIRHGNLSNKPGDNKETTVNSYLSALSVFFKYFVSHGKLEFNPVAGVERGKAQKHGVIRLNDREKDGFFDSIENGTSQSKHQQAYTKKTSVRDYAICLTMARTGLRVSELVGLNTDDIDFGDCSLTVLRKGNKYDRLFFDDEVAWALLEYAGTRPKYLEANPSEKAFFLVQTGKYKGSRLSVRAVERLVKKYAMAGSPSAGSRITPHKLRATYATDMLQATGNIALVQKALNHESPRTTMIYADERTIELEKARNVLMNRNNKSNRNK